MTFARRIAMLLLAALCGAGAVRAQADRDLARRIERWYGFWRAGKIELDQPVPGAALAARIYGEGVVPEPTERPVRHRDALVRMLDRARAHQTEVTTRALLELAAVGLDDRPLDPALAPGVVRDAAEDVLARFGSVAAIDTLVAASSAAERDDGVRVAALRALGRIDRPVLRVFVERALGDRERLVRLAAAEALLLRAQAASLPALARQLEREDDPVVLQALAMAMHRTVRIRGAAVDANAAFDAALAAVGALGRCEDWRADVALVELLMDLRSARAIPALIDVLDRCAAERRPPAILRDRAHAALVSLTGTRRDADDVAAWRAFWERERTGFRVAPQVERRSDAGATSAGFFGIPVRGSRIAFVIDVSGSMNAKLAPLEEGTSAGPRAEAASRLDWAKHELWNAATGLPAGARFGVVVFSSGVDAWTDALLPPTPDVLGSLRNLLRGLQAGGGTNLWGGLDRALGISGTAYGEVDPDGVDEVFVLTDGQPSAGEVRAPDAILAAVRDANRYRRARIHAVSLGGDGDFLRRLAEQNGGTFVAR